MDHNDVYITIYPARPGPVCLGFSWFWSQMSIKSAFWCFCDSEDSQILSWGGHDWLKYWHSTFLVHSKNLSSVVRLSSNWCHGLIVRPDRDLLKLIKEKSSILLDNEFCDLRCYWHMLIESSDLVGGVLLLCWLQISLW